MSNFALSIRLEEKNKFFLLNVLANSRNYKIQNIYLNPNLSVNNIQVLLINKTNEIKILIIIQI